MLRLHHWTELTICPGRLEVLHALSSGSFGFIPFGTHTINVIRFGSDEGIYTHEGNEHVPTWNHEIILEELSGNKCRYTDKVDIDAGWKTIFIWIWANFFYSHRQRKWIKLLKGKN